MQLNARTYVQDHRLLAGYDIIVDESKTSCLWAAGTTDPLEAMLNVVSHRMVYLEGEENRPTPN